MRKLMWFSVGFVISCGLCSCCVFDNWILPVIVLLAAVCLTAAVLGKRYPVFRRAAVILLGLTVGFGGLALFKRNHDKVFSHIVGETAYLNITATDYETARQYGIYANGVLELEGKTYRIRVYLNEDRKIQPGDSISGIFDVKNTSAENDKGSSYFRGQGIFLIAYQNGDVTVSNTEKIPVICYPAVWREQIQSILESTFPADTLAFAKSPAVGCGGRLVI